MSPIVTLEQKVALCQGQLISRQTAQLNSVGRDYVGFGIHHNLRTPAAERRSGRGEGGEEEEEEEEERRRVDASVLVSSCSL